MNYVLVIISTVLLAVFFILTKQFQMSEGTGAEVSLKYNSLLGLCTAIIFLVISGFKIEFSVFSVIFATLMSICTTVYTFLGFKVLKEGNMATYSLFLMSGGMLLPYIFGVAFLGEPLTVFRVLGVLVILIAVIISNKSETAISKKVLFLCVIIFIANGFVSTFSKCHQISTTYQAVDSVSFVFYTGVTKFIMCEIMLLFYKDRKIARRVYSRKSLLLIGGAALANGVSYMFQLIGAVDIPATVLYPIITGGSIIFTALAGWIFYKEKLSKIMVASIGLCFVGTLLFL